MLEWVLLENSFQRYKRRRKTSLAQTFFKDRLMIFLLGVQLLKWMSPSRSGLYKASMMLSATSQSTIWFWLLETVLNFNSILHIFLSFIFFYHRPFIYLRVISRVLIVSFFLVFQGSTGATSDDECSTLSSTLAGVDMRRRRERGLAWGLSLVSNELHQRQRRPRP